MANKLFWNQLLMRSDSIADIKAGAPDALEQVRAQLGTITEQFDRVFDPADQFEEYVAVAFCQALQRALTPQAAAPICKVSVRNKPLETAPVAAPKAVKAKTAKPQPPKKPRPKKRGGKG